MRAINGICPHARFERHTEEEFQGIITGVMQYGLFVELKGLIVDGFIHISELPWRDVRFDNRGRRLVGGRKGGSLRLGDGIIVRIKAIDLAARKLDLSYVAKIPSSPPPRDKQNPA